MAQWSRQQCSILSIHYIIDPTPLSPTRHAKNKNNCKSQWLTVKRACEAGSAVQINPPGGVVWLIVVFCTELTHITLIFFISDTVHVKY